MSQERSDDAKRALEKVYGSKEAESKYADLVESSKNASTETITYTDMLLPGRSQFHPTTITIMGQVNQALTGYGAVSVYGPQIFELLGFSTTKAEFLTLGNYISYCLMMTFAWLSIDVYGRRKLLLLGSIGLSLSFILLTLFGGLAANYPQIPDLAVEIPG